MKKLKQDEEQIACIPFHIDSMHRRELPGSLECKVKTSLFWKNRFRYWKLPGCIQCGIELICSELGYFCSALKMARIGMPTATGTEPDFSDAGKSMGDAYMKFLTCDVFHAGELVGCSVTSAGESRQCLIPGSYFSTLLKSLSFPL